MRQDVRDLLSEALLASAMSGPSPMLTISERALEALVDAARVVDEPAAPLEGAPGLSVDARASRLRQARKRRFASAQEAADSLGMKGVTVRAHENGQNGFNVQDATKYARAYGVPLEWLLTGKEPQRAAS